MGNCFDCFENNYYENNYYENKNYDDEIINLILNDEIIYDFDYDHFQHNSLDDSMY